MQQLGTITPRKALSVVAAVLVMASLVAPSVGADSPPYRPAQVDVTGWPRLDTVTPLRALAGPSVPGPRSGDGIGPGSYLLIDRTDGSFICTANFVWAAGTARYLGAAGHCFLEPNDTHAPSSNPGYRVKKVSVCVSGCAFGGQLGAVIQGDLRDLGPVAYARQSAGGVDVGNDFGLVRIPSGLLPLIRPSVPVWGGPVGAPTTPTLGERVCTYGNAGGLGEVFVTKARAGVSGVSTPNAWFASMPSAPGDSGAAIVVCPALSGTSAAGVLTHLATNGTGFVAGTTVARAKAMALEAGLSIDIVNAG